MLELFRTLGVRYLVRRGIRTVLIVLSIALGVAVLVGTRSVHQLMKASGQTAYTPLAALGDLFVTNPTGVSRDLLNNLRQAKTDGRLPGVAAVRPFVVQRSALLPDFQNRRVTLIGVDIDGTTSTLLPDDNPWGLLPTQTRQPTTIEFGLIYAGYQFPAFVGTALMAELPPGTTTLRVKGGSGTSQSVELYGTVDATGAASALGGNVVYTRAGDAAKLIGQPDRFTRLDVTLEKGANLGEVQARLQELVGPANEVVTLEANDAKVSELMSSVEVMFTLGSICALVVGLFLVYNALSVSVAERRHDIGVLRSMGATRTQVAGLFAGEALLLGLVGSSLGVPLGWLMAWLSVGVVRQMLTDLFGVTVVPWPPINVGLIALALGCGVVTALLAALVPALQAAREEPADAVRRAPPSGGMSVRMGHIVLCAALVLGGIACVPLSPYLPPKAGGYGAPVLILVGLLMATPLLAGSAARLVQQPARWLLGVPERLAADNLARSPGRTGLVIAALAACVALMVQTSGVMQSSEDAVIGWLDRTVAADLFVTANSPVASTGNSQPMSDRLRQELAALPEVRQVVPVRFHLTDHGIQKVYIVAVDAAHFIDRQRLRDLLPGMDDFPRLKEPGTAIVSENFAALYGVRPGDVLEFPGKTGQVKLKVLASMQDFTWMRGTVFVDRANYQREFGDSDIDIFNVYLRDGVDREAVRQKMLQKWGNDEALFVLTREETKDGVVKQVRTLYAFGYAQQLVVGVVAALGVLMALLISVLQRRRELGLLRAVGASQAQVVRTVLAEAMLMGLVGAAIGLAFGIPLEWYMVRILLVQEAGFAMPMSIPWTAALMVIGLALTLATAAGVWPALHAVRLRIADAIAYE